jgi:hypothetical protein
MSSFFRRSFAAKYIDHKCSLPIDSPFTFAIVVRGSPRSLKEALRWLSRDNELQGGQISFPVIRYLYKSDSDFTACSCLIRVCVLLAGHASSMKNILEMLLSLVFKS